MVYTWIVPVGYTAADHSQQNLPVHGPGHEQHYKPCEDVRPPSIKRARMDPEEELAFLTDMDAIIEIARGSQDTHGMSYGRHVSEQCYQFGSFYSGALSPTIDNPISVEVNRTPSPVSQIPDLQLQGSQVTMMLPDGSKSSLWDQPVPAVFAAYQPPALITTEASDPNRRRRSRLSGAKSNHCLTCNKTLVSRYKYNQHVSTVHASERSHVCEVCGKRFPMAKSLKCHKSKVHTSEKPYSCNRCGRGFTDPMYRNIHLVSEACIRAERYIRRTGQGWDCTVCESGQYKSHDQAERHAHQHQTGNGLTCPVCPFNVESKKGHILVKHVKEYHPEYMANLGI